jgi:hypothetical protein
MIRAMRPGTVEGRVWVWWEWGAVMQDPWIGLEVGAGGGMSHKKAMASRSRLMTAVMRWAGVARFQSSRRLSTRDRTVRSKSRKKRSTLHHIEDFAGANDIGEPFFNRPNRSMCEVEPAISPTRPVV